MRPLFREKSNVTKKSRFLKILNPMKFSEKSLRSQLGIFFENSEGFQYLEIRIQ